MHTKVSLSVTDMYTVTLFKTVVFLRNILKGVWRHLDVANFERAVQTIELNFFQWLVSSEYRRDWSQTYGYHTRRRELHQAFGSRSREMSNSSLIQFYSNIYEAVNSRQISTGMNYGSHEDDTTARRLTVGIVLTSQLRRDKLHFA